LSPAQIIVGMFLRSFVHALIFFLVIVWTYPLTLDISVFGTTIFMGLMVVVQLREIMTIFSWTWVIFLGFLIWIFFYPVAVSLVDQIFGDGPILNAQAFPASYEIGFLLIGIMTAFEYIIYGFRRTVYPTNTEMLMEFDRGYSESQTRPRMHGLGVLGGVLGEGVDRTVFLPAKKVGEAFAGYRRSKKQVDIEDGTGDGVIVVVNEAEASGPGTQFGKHRSGYDFSGPSS
jgi:hypothetical protein